MLTLRRVLICVLIGCLLSGAMLQPVVTLAAPKPTREVITAANASKLQPLFKLGKGVVRYLSWSPDGKQLFVSTDSGVYSYDPNNLKQEPRLLDPNATNRVVFNLAETKLATFSEHGNVSIWDAKTLMKIDQIAIPVVDQPRYPDSIRAVWFDQVDAPIIAYEHEFDLAVWNSQTQNYLIKNQSIWSAYEVQVSADRQMMLTSGGMNGSGEPAELWDLKTGNQIWKFKVENIEPGRINVNAAAFNITKTLIATANGNAPTDASDGLIGNDVILWDVQTGKQLFTLKGHGSWVTQVQFQPKGDLIASGSGDSTVRLWNVKTGKQTALFRAEDTVNALAFNPSGTFLAATSEGGELNLWNVGSGKFFGHVNGFGGDTGPAYSLGVDNSNGQCCIAFTRDSGQIAHGQGNGIVQAWDTATGKVTATLSRHGQAISGLTFANRETVLVSASYDSTLQFWNIASGQSIYKQQLPNSPQDVILYALQTSPNGKYMSAKTTFKQGGVWLYSTATRQKIWDSAKFILDDVPEDYALPNAFSPDSRFLAFAGNTQNYQLYLYEIGTRKDPIQLPLSCDTSGGCTDVLQNLAFSADGKRLYVAFRDGAIDVLDLEQQKVISSLPYLSLDYSGETPTATRFNGSIAVSYSRYGRNINGVIYVRNLQNGQILQRHETKNVFEYNLNPQGTLVAWSGDKLEVWSVETGMLVFEQSSLLGSENYAVPEIAFSPDGTLLVIADGRDVITVYGIPPN